jgi:CheY-like chemotaxis protein
MPDIKRILLVHEDNLAATLLGRVFLACNIWHTLIEEYEIPMASFEGGQYDAIVIDLQEPEGRYDAYTVAALRARNVAIPIIVLSGNRYTRPTWLKQYKNTSLRKQLRREFLSTKHKPSDQATWADGFFYLLLNSSS